MNSTPSIRLILLAPYFLYHLRAILRNVNYDSCTPLRAIVCAPWLLTTSMQRYYYLQAAMTCRLKLPKKKN